MPLTMCLDGAVIAAVTLAAAAVVLYLSGTGMHVDFVQVHLLDAAGDDWASQGPPSNS